MSKDTELELSGPPPSVEPEVEIKEEAPKAKAKKPAKAKKGSLSKEDQEYLTSFFGNLAISYGDPIEGESPAIAAQRKRALAIDEFLKSVVK